MKELHEIKSKKSLKIQKLESQVATVTQEVLSLKGILETILTRFLDLISNIPESSINYDRKPEIGPSDLSINNGKLDQNKSKLRKGKRMHINILFDFDVVSFTSSDMFRATSGFHSH